MNKLLGVIALSAFGLAACTTTDSKVSELKQLNLSCSTISSMHAKNERAVDINKGDAEEKAKGNNAGMIVGALFFTPLLAVAAAKKQGELDRYQVPMKENHALRKLAEEKKCPVPKTKYPEVV